MWQCIRARQLAAEERCLLSKEARRLSYIDIFSGMNKLGLALTLIT
jgi:hypothetical protein